MINLFIEAIEKDELCEFALGLNDYFILDRENGGHWVLLSWEKYILSCIALNGEKKTSIHINTMLKCLVNAGNYDIEQRIDALLYHVHVYFYNKKEGKIKMNMLEEHADEIKESFKNYFVYLKRKNKQKLNQVMNAIKIIKRNGGLADFNLT